MCVEPSDVMALELPIILHDHDGPRSPLKNRVIYWDGQRDALGSTMSHVTVGTRYHVTKGKRAQENCSCWENKEFD